MGAPVRLGSILNIKCGNGELDSIFILGSAMIISSLIRESRFHIGRDILILSVNAFVGLKYSLL